MFPPETSPHKHSEHLLPLKRRSRRPGPRRTPRFLLPVPDAPAGSIAPMSNKGESDLFWSKASFDSTLGARVSTCTIWRPMMSNRTSSTLTGLDWVTSSKLLVFVKSHQRFCTIFSRTSDEQRRLDAGLKFDWTSGSSVGLQEEDWLKTLEGFWYLVCYQGWVHHFLSGLCVSCLGLTAWGSYQGAKLLHFTSFFSAGAMRLKLIVMSQRLNGRFGKTELN